MTQVKFEWVELESKSDEFNWVNSFFLSYLTPLLLIL